MSRYYKNEYLKYINRYMTKSLPVMLRYIFIQKSNIDKPISKKLVLPKIRTYRKPGCLSNTAPNIWNALPGFFSQINEYNNLNKILRY